MTKGTLLKKTKNELVDMLIKSQKDYAHIKNDYDDVCDNLFTKTEENNEYVDSILKVIDKYRIITIITCGLLIASIIANICIFI